MRRALALLFPLLAVGCSRGARRPEVRAATVPAGERCLDCHASLVRSYRETGMAQAAGPLAPRELEGLEAVSDSAGWTYRFEVGRIAESWKTGELAVSAPIDFAIGAGRMDRSFAARVGDLLWFAPLEVVGAGRDRRAALAPGHSIRGGTRFSVPIVEECLACHTDRLPARDYPLNLRPDPSGWQPSGISCSACHAESERHADWREADLAGKRHEGADPIRTPGRSDRIGSVSLCARCHLQGDGSVLLEPGARGVPAPGGDLLAVRAVFVAAVQTDEIGFVSQVERLVRSKCFTRSSGQAALSCTTCHDPHRSAFDPAERAIVRGACAKCHAGPDACSLPGRERAGKDCVGCHMRGTGAFDVARVEIHDHFIRKEVVPPSPAVALRTKESKDGSLAPFAWPGAPVPAWADDPGFRMMAEIAAGHPELAMPFSDREPGPGSAALPTYHHLHGSLLEQAGRLEEARAAYARALEIDPRQTETQVNLGLLLGRLGRAKEGIAVLDAAIAEHPKAASALRNRAVLELGLGDEARFAADLEAAFAIAPDASLARALADRSAKAGDAAGADRWSRAAHALDPSADSGTWTTRPGPR